MLHSNGVLFTRRFNMNDPFVWYSYLLKSCRKKEKTCKSCLWLMLSVIIMNFSWVHTYRVFFLVIYQNIWWKMLIFSVVLPWFHCHYVFHCPYKRLYAYVASWIISIKSLTSLYLPSCFATVFSVFVFPLQKKRSNATQKGGMQFRVLKMS